MSSHRPQSTEDAVELYMSARARGEKVDPTTFAAEHAHLGEELREALDALAALDGAKSDVGLGWLASASQIGPYRIVREIGRGGMGVVLEAVEEPLGRRVALKVLPAELLQSASARARFRREAEMAARLEHSGIATVYGAGVEDERPWIAMRFVDGITLSQAIHTAREAGASCVRVPPKSGTGREAALAIAVCLAKIARALQAAHEHGIVHRDVKPSNIMISADGTPTLVDFGLAIPEDAEGFTLTRTGENAGTPAYMAPEILSGERLRSDAQCDVYSLGVTLYECLALRRPFDAATPFALTRAILSGTPTELCSVHHAVPRDLAIIVAVAMERDRGRRYASAAALAADLEACARGGSIKARPMPLHGRVLRWMRREPLQATLVTLLALSTIVAAVAAGSWWQGRGQVQAAAHMSKREEFEGYLQTGYIHLAVNWLEEADQDFLNALAMNPWDPEALAGRAIVALRQKQPERVRAITESATSPAFDTLRALADGSVPKADFGPKWFANAPAVEMFVDGWRIMRQMETCAPAEKRRLGMLAFERYDEAIRRSVVTRMYYHVQRASAANDSGDERAIRSSAASLAVLWPEDARSNYTAGLALAKLSPAEAVPRLQKAAMLEPGWAQPHHALGLQCFALGQFQRAASEFEFAAMLKPRDGEACLWLGKAREELGCADEARAAYEAAVSRRPDLAEAWQRLALAHSPERDERAAEHAWRAALIANPRATPARLAFAKFLEERARDEEARAELDAVVSIEPEGEVGWIGLARLETKRGAHQAALAAAEAGLVVSPEQPELIACRDRARAALADGQ